MFYKEIQEQSQGVQLKAQILKIYLLTANYGSTLMCSICVPVCPQKLWIRHCYALVPFLSKSMHKSQILKGKPKSFIARTCF